MIVGQSFAYMRFDVFQDVGQEKGSAYSRKFPVRIVEQLLPQVESIRSFERSLEKPTSVYS